MNCIFCKIIKNEVPAYKIIESEGALAILDVFPKTPGHALVLPKRHIENIYNIDEKAMGEVFYLARKIALAHKNLGADGINILQNNGKAAGQAVFHVHVHVIPRKKNAPLDILKGEALPQTTEEFKRMTELLKENIDKVL